MSRLRLGVNIDHVATLRNARGGADPDPVRAALLAQEAGADGITLHVREDRRHVREADLRAIAKAVALPINFEMAARPEMVALALEVRPHAVCLVPERRAEVTTEGGLDAAGQQAALAPLIAELRDSGARVSLFIDPERRQLEAARALGAPVVELHTGAYAEAFAAGGGPAAAAPLRRAAQEGAALGLEIHAGHGLNFANVGLVAAIHEIVELNIGHFLVGEAVFIGLAAAIGRMRQAMDEARRP